MSKRSDLADFGSDLFENIREPNYIINGNFDIWQRGVSQTSNGFGSDDRWINAHAGSTKTHTREEFSPGESASQNRRYYSRTVVSSVAGANNYVLKYQKIENVLLCSGKTFTLTFWARTDADKLIAVEFVQSFGSGGTPSGAVEGDEFPSGVRRFQLGTNWQFFEHQVTFPSVEGKTLGTQDNSSFYVVFWFDAGSNWNSRTNSLGQQSGTFDIAMVQLEEGNNFTGAKERFIGDELKLCQRYYQTNYNQGVYPGQASNSLNPALKIGTFSTVGGATVTVDLVQSMRQTPTITLYSDRTGAINNVGVNGTSDAAVSTVSVTNQASGSFRVANSTALSTVGHYFRFMYTADAEI